MKFTEALGHYIAGIGTGIGLLNAVLHFIS